MSIWVRIRESLAALVRGTPLSEIFETLVRQPEHRVGFTIAVIALSAKMAKADGRVTRDEIAAFREIFHIPPEAERNAARIYNLARTDVAGFDSYARQIARMFRDRPAILADLLEGLVYIAMSDGEYHPSEAVFLETVAEIFGIPEAQFRCIRARYGSGVDDPYAVLDVPASIGDKELRQRYRELVRMLHPDVMIGRGAPIEAQALAERRLAAINRAYDRIRTERAP